MAETKILFSVDSAVKDLQQSLLELQQAEKEIQKAITQLNEELANIDKILPQHAAEWQKLREEYFNEIVAKLEAEGISLTAEEKAELRSGGTTFSSIRKKLEKLKKLQIELSKESDFVIVTCDTIVAALSRNLQKVDDKSVKSVIKKLKKVIGDEDDAAKKIKTAHAKQHEKIIAIAKQLKTQINAIALPSADKIQQIEEQFAAATKKEIAVQKAQAPVTKK